MNMKKESLKQSAYVAPDAEIILLKMTGSILQDSIVEDPDPSDGDDTY